MSNAAMRRKTRFRALAFTKQTTSSLSDLRLI
jgi:hypothetical protein